MCDKKCAMKLCHMMLSLFNNLRIEFHSSASWVICQFDHCVHDPINAPRMKFNPYIYILK